VRRLTGSVTYDVLAEKLESIHEEFNIAKSVSPLFESPGGQAILSDRK
jgi:hypothetical protein